jgi:hypothetical protein
VLFGYGGSALFLSEADYEQGLPAHVWTCWKRISKNYVHEHEKAQVLPQKYTATLPTRALVQSSARGKECFLQSPHPM